MGLRRVLVEEKTGGGGWGLDYVIMNDEGG